MAEGTREARNFVFLGFALLGGLIFAALKTDLFDGESKTLVVLLLVALAYSGLAQAASLKWHYAQPKATTKGVTVGRRSLLAALRSQDGKLLLWEEIELIQIREPKPERPGAIRRLTLKTKKGWVYYFFEDDFPEAFEALEERFGKASG